MHTQRLKALLYIFYCFFTLGVGKGVNGGKKKKKEIVLLRVETLFFFFLVKLSLDILLGANKCIHIAVLQFWHPVIITIEMEH